MKNSPRLMFFFGLIAFAVIMIVVNNNPELAKSKIGDETVMFWFYRVLAALAAAAISISIPGMLKINYDAKGGQMNLMTNANNDPVPMTLAEKEPTITASGAIAVFVLVYLFNPIG